MRGKVIFIAGVYGVGKSTLCSMLSDSLNIPSFSSGDLISEKNGEKYGANKSVKDKDSNQRILIKSVKEKIEKSQEILLSGHFCILNSKNEVVYLPEFVYKELHISKIILLEAPTNTIVENLKKRDSKEYNIDTINELIITENQQANKIAYEINVPLIVHDMNFDESDLDRLLSVIEGSEA